MSEGPLHSSAAVSCAASSSQVVAREAGTPMPRASATQSMAGEPISVSARAARPLLQVAGQAASGRAGSGQASQPRNCSARPGAIVL